MIAQAALSFMVFLTFAVLSVVGRTSDPLIVAFGIVGAALSIWFLVHHRHRHGRRHH